jgi:hypothetical protein
MVQMANGKWQMANGKWQMANGKWQTQKQIQDEAPQKDRRKMKQEDQRQ